MVRVVNGNDNPVSVIEALVVLGQRRGVHLNRVKIAKLLYLADLQAIDQGRHPFSGILWVWGNHGPWNNRFYSHFDDLARSGVLVETPSANYFGTPEFTYTPTEAATAAGEFIDILDAVLAEHGSKTASELKDLTYRTGPMVKVQAAGARGDVLDLALQSGAFLDAVNDVAEEVLSEARADHDDLPRWANDPGRPLMTVSRPRFHTA